MCVVLLLLNDFFRRFNLSRTQALTLHLAFNTRGLQPMVECQLCGVSSSEARWAQYASGPHRRPLGEQCELCLFVRMLWYGRLSFPQFVALVDFSLVDSLRFCKRRLALERLLSSM